MLTSAPTGATDEVWVDAPEGRLQNLTKNRDEAPPSASEFVGILRISSELAQRMRSLYDAFVGGDLEAARKQQFAIMRFSRSLPRTDNGEYAAEEKYILTLRDICEEYVNPLYRRLTDDEKARVVSALQGLRVNPASSDWKTAS